MTKTELTLDQPKVAAGVSQTCPDEEWRTEREIFSLGDIFKDFNWPMPQLFNDQSSLIPMILINPNSLYLFSRLLHTPFSFF